MFFILLYNILILLKEKNVYISELIKNDARNSEGTNVNHVQSGMNSGIEISKSKKPLQGIFTYLNTSIWTAFSFRSIIKFKYSCDFLKYYFILLISLNS